MRKDNGKGEAGFILVLALLALAAIAALSVAGLK